MPRPATLSYARFPSIFALSVVVLYGCSSDDDDDPASSGVDLLANLGPISESQHNGEDGLLGGWSLDALRATTPPSFYADPLTPTLSELRRAAIYNNYTALIDQSDAGGYGRLYGLDPASVGFPGTEYQAYVGEGINRARVMVQVPDSFDASSPCLVVAPSSGSRGVYGAVGTGGEWGLEKNCAVTYTDAGKGTGAVELTQNIGFSMRLEALDLASTEVESTFVVPTTATVLEPDASSAVPGRLVAPSISVS